ncbi:MAG: hypothetical protein PHO66_06450, partial [Eubacteriales bacterium]|nr:hypothetical protein [Eubacteriales bacterium]
FRPQADAQISDAYLVPYSDVNHVSTSQAVSIFLKNLTKHPRLVMQSVTDAYLACSNFYGAQSENGVSYFVVKEVSLTRATENDRIGSYVFYPSTYSNVYYLSEDLSKNAAPYYYKKTAGVTITDFFRRWLKPTNMIFTFGFLLLPFVWIASVVMARLKRDEMVFSLATIASSLSLAYMLLISFSGSILDRYAFTVFGSTWVAILLVTYGIGRAVWRRRLKNSAEQES